MRRITKVLAAVMALPLLIGSSTVAATPGQRHRAEVISPAPHSQIDRSGSVDVVIELGPGVRPSKVVVQLVLRHGTARARAVDITRRLTFTAGRGAATLTGALVPGLSELRVSRRNGGRRAHLRLLDSSVFSWEPALDAATATRCDVLDPKRCLLPFPNDFYTVRDAATDTGRRVHLAEASMPANAGGVHIDPTEWNRNDGFSPGTPILTHVPGVDLRATGAVPITDIERSLDRRAPVVLIDASTGQRHPVWTELDSLAPSPDTQVLFVRPAVNLEEGHRYIVAMRRMRRADGTVIGPRRAFRLYRDRIPTFLPAVERRRPHMEQLFRSLRHADIARRGLYAAWDFTVASQRSLSERLLHMRDDAFANLGTAAPAFTVDSVEEFTDPVAEPELLRRVSGSFEVPLYLTGQGEPGSRLTNAVGDGLPVRNGTYTASYICNIPRSVSVDGGDPVTPARGGIYGHGLLGSRNQVNSGQLQALSLEHGFVFCGSDWIGMSSEDIGNAVAIIQDQSHFPTLADRLQQGILNNLFLARLVKLPHGLASHEAFRMGPQGTPAIATGEVFYVGGSQGGILGGAATAVSQEWTRAVLGVPGMNYSTLLDRSIDFDPFRELFVPAYTDPIERQLTGPLVQMLWDRGESNGYAHHMTDDPLPNTPPHQVLLELAFGDHQVANVATEVMARTIGARIRRPALDPGRHADVNPYWGIPAIPSFPYSGSALVVWDIGPLRTENGEVAGTPPPPTTNTPPRDGIDPHGPDASEEVSGRLQRSEFLRRDGAVVDVCGHSPCYLAGWSGP